MYGYMYLYVYIPNGMESMARKKPKRPKVGRPAGMAKFVQKSDLKAELIFGATAATGGRVKFLNSCVNFSENNPNYFIISPQKR